MQYVRSISGSVSKTWNSINPATLSGAVDVIVVEHEDGTLACSPFHVRFGKFSLLRPHEKKVEFKVNDVKREYPMKLGEGGEAFFVFETSTAVPEAMQTSPLVSPAQSPEMRPSSADAPALPDSESLELTGQLDGTSRKLEESMTSEQGLSFPGNQQRTQSASGDVPTLSSSLGEQSSFGGYLSAHAKLPVELHRSNTDHGLPPQRIGLSQSFDSSQTSKPVERPVSPMGTARSSSPPPMTSEEAKTRAINLSKKLWTSNIPSQVTDQGDLMLDMTGYKSSDAEALRAEVIARKILSEELEGNYDIGSLIGADEKGNLWIYSSEEAKEQANKRLASSLHDLSRVTLGPSTDAISDPGYHSDDARSESSVELRAPAHFRHDSDSAVGMSSPPFSAGSETKSFAKTLRLTSDQLKSLELNPGQNTMSFTVNRATCTACLWLWRYDVPIIISDIDGTITKSDALGHVLNMIGRDWTHLGVAKLYTEIAANGYNFLYLTSRSVGQADTTRAYLSGVLQDGGYKLPKGPVIMSPDRTMAALRREVYLRKPEVFKMACLRDIMQLFLGASGNRAMFVDPGSPPGEPSSPTQAAAPTKLGENPDTARKGIPFYAGFGNRLTDAISYRSVNIPSTRIFTINSSSEVSLDLSTLSKYRTGYTTMRDIVDHYFPPTGLLVKGGGEEFTDFTYWREKPLELVDFSASESEDSDVDDDDEDVPDDDADADVDDEAEVEADEEADDDHVQRTPMFTPGILSEDEYATMAESLYSTGGRPSLEQSVMEESMYSARGEKEDVTLEEEDEGDDGDDEGDASPRSTKGRRRGRGETVTRREGEEDDGEGDDEEEEDDDVHEQTREEEEEEDTNASLELDEQQRDVQKELRSDLQGLAKALSSPGRQQRDKGREERDVKT